MFSTFPTLVPFLLFAFVASITPGPTNILVLSNSVRYGFKASLPIIFGACSSAALIVLLMGCGFGESLSRVPLLQMAMQWIGVAWLSYLAWQIFHSPSETFDTSVHSNHPRTSFWSAVRLQWINAKAWTMAMAVVSVFAGSGPDRFNHVICLSLVFFLVALPCLSTWALLGSGMAQLAHSTKTTRSFYRIMGLLLFGSTCLSAWVV
ncbi:LysE family translocator [Pseudomonas sp. B21-040]|uniref:LysE family translocator n=1 Tax=Pseudomonas sp. B21-040 TaxID=2895486 RepID=UPI00215EF73C|nr:LysE family translocator [Pseudomonas sp. B21-040]UVL43339.1 LysE family translocator [Pseudomonas sp. B21-040]